MAGAIRHVVSDTPRILVVDGSKLVRKLIGDVIAKELPSATVVACDSVASAQAAMADGADLVTTSLALPDGDGLAVARSVREEPSRLHVPVIVVSGEAQERLEARTFGEDVTDYFDKALGHQALATFIRGYVQPEPIVGARVLYVEDSKVVALATTRMMKAHDLQVVHMTSAEDALEYLHEHYGQDDIGADLVLTDVYLKGLLGGRELVSQIRSAFCYDKRRLPVLVMTGDHNPDNQRVLLQDGANDLVIKPIEERLLITKLLFQLRTSGVHASGQ